MACTAPTTLTIAEAHTFTLTDINRPVKVTGTVSKIDKLTYGNLGITLTVGTGSVYVYVDSRINADAVTALKALAVGANTSIAGWLASLTLALIGLSIRVLLLEKFRKRRPSYI
jgi:RPA family protein